MTGMTALAFGIEASRLRATGKESVLTKVSERAA
jgi:hypothetical protein